MNNYLSLNLVNGRLGRVAGGGRPKFILDEQNEVQLYVLDFPKPSTYPPDSLSDAYAYEVTPRDFSGSSVTLRAGVRGGGAIISTSSFFNLPTNISVASNSNVIYANIAGSSNKSAIYNLFFSIEPITTLGSLFSFTITFSDASTSRSVTSSNFSFQNTLSEIKSILDNAFFAVSSEFYFAVQSGSGGIEALSSNLYQVSDYSYSFNGTQTLRGIELPSPVSFNVTLNNVNASSNPGKYGYLDFSSPSWDAIIGTKNEATIWMEAMIGSDTIAQGNAIICRKMT